jgi:hypothetical protein
MFWATVGLVVISVSAMTVSYFLLRTQVDPDIIVYTKHDELRSSVLLIVIENIGAGVAYNVRFHLDRPIVKEAWGVEKPSSDPIKTMSHGPLVTGIPILAPKERRVLTWGQFGGLSAALGDRGGIRVTCEFESKKNFPWDPTDHVHHSVLEVYSFERTDASEAPESRQVRELEKISRDIASIQRSLHTLAETARWPEIAEVIERIHAKKRKRESKE